LCLDPSEKTFGAGFLVMPNVIYRDGFPALQINARLPGGPDGGIWESFPGPFKEDDVRLTLLDLFDWTPLGYIDLRFYVVLVDSFRSHPDKVGHHALVDVNQADVFLDR
jgi:hypothetical protein